MRHADLRGGVRTMLRRVIGEKAFMALRAAYWPLKLRFVEYEAETRLLPLLVPRGGVCIDVGGNFGQFASYLSKAVGDSGVVHSFEPLSYNRAIFESVAARMNLRNVVIHRFALSDGAGTLSIVVDEGNTAEAHVSGSTDGEQVEALSLDEWVMNAMLARLDFLKVDVEGFELAVLRGARKSITRFRPGILCEVGSFSSTRYGVEPEEVLEFLGECGYSAFAWRNDVLVPRGSWTPDTLNYIFLQEHHLSRMRDSGHVQAP